MPVLSLLRLAHMLCNTLGNPATMFRKISIDVPFPIPLIEILSEIHIRNAVPPVINATEVMMNFIPGSITIPLPINAIDIPNDCPIARRIVTYLVHWVILSLSLPPSFCISSILGKITPKS